MPPHQPRRSARSRPLQHDEQHPSSHYHDAGANPRRQPTMSPRCGPRIESGSFGMLPGHADLLTALVPSVVRWRTVDGAACFCAVRGGVFAVAGGRNVSVACREGVVGDSLDELEAKYVPCARSNSKLTVRREPSKSAFMLWRCVSSCDICGPIRLPPHDRAGGCIVTSERIIARLRAEGYDLAHSHAGAGLAVRGAGFDRLARAAQRAVEREAAGSCRSRTLARRPARPDRRARLDRSSSRRCSVSSSDAGSTGASELGSFFPRPC